MLDVLPDLLRISKTGTCWRISFAVVRGQEKRACRNFLDLELDAPLFKFVPRVEDTPNPLAFG